MNAKQYIGMKIREFRNEAGLTLEEVGKAVNKKPRTISSWQVGRSEPNADELIILCQLFHKRISDFYNEESYQLALALTDAEEQLIFSIRELDDYGQEKAFEYVADLVDSGNYERKNGPAAEVQAS